MNPKIVEQSPITMAHMKTELKSIKKRDEELSFRSGKVEDYLNSFHVLSKKDAETLFKKLKDLDLPRFKDEYVCKVVDMLPASEEELKLILSGYTLALNKEAYKKILDALDDFLPEKKK